MKQTFIEKYRDYFKDRNTRDAIFRIIQGENESLEYYERFQVSYKISHSFTLDKESLICFFLNGVKEQNIETLKLMDNGDTFQ